MMNANNGTDEGPRSIYRMDLRGGKGAREWGNSRGGRMAIRTDSARDCAGRRRGFTLIELLVVVGIIGILLAMMVPSLMRARDRVKTTYCLSNERAIGQAVYLYAADNSGWCVPRMISRSDSSLGWSGPPSYPTMFDGFTQDAYWSDQVLLGQYAANTGGDNMNPTFTHGTVSKRSPFICPSDRQHDEAGNATGECSYGMGPNFPSVSPPLGPGAPLPYWNMWKILG